MSSILVLLCPTCNWQCERAVLDAWHPNLNVKEQHFPKSRSTNTPDHSLGSAVSQKLMTYWSQSPCQCQVYCYALDVLCLGCSSSTGFGAQAEFMCHWEVSCPTASRRCDDLPVVFQLISVVLVCDDCVRRFWIRSRWSVRQMHWPYKHISLQVEGRDKNH